MLNSLSPMIFKGEIIFKWDPLQTTLAVGFEITHPKSKKIYVSGTSTCRLEEIGFDQTNSQPEVCPDCNQLLSLDYYNEIAYESRHATGVVRCIECILKGVKS